MKLWMLALIAYGAEGNYDNRHHKIYVQTESFTSQELCEHYKQALLKSDKLRNKYMSLDASCKQKKVHLD